jgi:subtilisin family serine protease
MKKSKSPATHIISQKVDAKLRMYANCDQEVNENRAAQNGNLVVVQQTVQPVAAKPAYSLLQAAPADMRPVKFTKELKKGKVKKPSSGIKTNVFIQVTQKTSRSGKPFRGELTRQGNIISSSVFLTDLKKISEREDVVGIEMPRVLKLADPVIGDKYAKEPSLNKWKVLREDYPTKKDVLIGIIDVQGFDFSHPDFLDEKGRTRFIKIWDQGSDFRKPPAKYKYGAEFDNAELNKAIQQSGKLGVPATELEKQSSTVIGSHGTHVASIAAGNSGVLPSAKIAAVTIALKQEDNDRRKSFYDSSSVVHAIDYLLALADKEGMPISINISLGTNGHAHDGSDAGCRWIDAALSIPGRCVCLAAGNAGQEKAITEKDLGFVMGRIHTSGKIEATGLTNDIFWTVVGDGTADFSENEMELWYAPQDRISVMIKPPEEDKWIGPVGPGFFIENKQLSDGSYISIYNDLYHFSNGSNYIGIYLSPNLKKKDSRLPVKAGVWQVRLKGEEIRFGEYDGWIERDDPRPLGNFGQRQAWNFPSFLAEKSNVDNTSISSLACARYVISSGNYDSKQEKINISSSQGPTRDKRNKPEIVAPGTDITAAKGFSSKDDQWISMTGTSMASPYTCGIAAWMLSLNPGLSAAQIQGIMIRTSIPLTGSDYKWKDDSGFGLINPEACLQESRIINKKKDITDGNKNNSIGQRGLPVNKQR